MKRIAFLLAFLVSVGLGSARAQTHVSLSLGLGVRAPLVPAVVVVERPYFHRAPVILVAPPRYAVRPLFVERVIVTRRAFPHHHHRRYHRVLACSHHRCGY